MIAPVWVIANLYGRVVVVVLDDDDDDDDNNSDDEWRLI